VENIVKFIESKYKDFFSKDENCLELISNVLEKYMKSSKLSSAKKIHQKFFISYMKRRIDFLTNNQQFLNNNFGVADPKLYKSWKFLGSILMEQMLHEVDNFSNRKIRCNWTEYSHVYFIYAGQSFKVLALNKYDEQCAARIGKLESLEVGKMKDTKFPMIPERKELKQKSNLIKYLSIALNTKIETVTSIINDNKYVLTLDYTLKILQIHERQKNRMPTIVK